MWSRYKQLSFWENWLELMLKIAKTYTCSPITWKKLNSHSKLQMDQITRNCYWWTDLMLCMLRNFCFILGAGCWNTLCVSHCNILVNCNRLWQPTRGATSTDCILFYPSIFISKYFVHILYQCMHHSMGLNIQLFQ